MSDLVTTGLELVGLALLAAAAGVAAALVAPAVGLAAAGLVLIVESGLLHLRRPAPPAEPDGKVWVG